jgi:hypothetical protein
VGELSFLAARGVQRVPCAPGASAQTAQQGHRMLPAFSHIVPLVWVNIPRPQYGKVTFPSQGIAVERMRGATPYD